MQVNIVFTKLRGVVLVTGGCTKTEPWDEFVGLVASRKMFVYVVSFLNTLIQTPNQ